MKATFGFAGLTLASALLASCAELLDVPPSPRQPRGVPQEEEVPAGSYRDSCRRIYARGDTLRAECRRVDGEFVQTEMQGFSDCRKDIVNDDGQLRCGRWRSPPQPQPQPLPKPRRELPAGSYRESCWAFDFDGDDLVATCKARDGSKQESRLHNVDRCEGEVENRNGFLRCDRPGQARRHEIPPGSYQLTCNQIRLDGDDLVASCQTRRGNWIGSRLDHVDDCGREISNQNGRLTCGN